MALIKVVDAMSRNPIVVSLNDTVQECANKMINNKVGSVVVLENGILRGIITEKDLVEKVVAKSFDSKKKIAQDVMVSRVHTTNPDKDLQEVIRYMIQNRVRRLPVVDKNNKLVGMLTETDIVRIQPALVDLITERWLVGKRTI